MNDRKNTTEAQPVCTCPSATVGAESFGARNAWGGAISLPACEVCGFRGGSNDD